MAANPQAVATFYKAQSMAYWSFIGLLIPLIGVIVGSMAKSRLRLLEGGSQEEQNEIDRTYSIAAWGCGLSVFFLVCQVVGIISWGALTGIWVARNQEQLEQIDSSYIQP